MDVSVNENDGVGVDDELDPEFGVSVDVGTELEERRKRYPQNLRAVPGVRCVVVDFVLPSQSAILSPDVHITTMSI